jgi:hypothetical protein
MDEGGRRGYRPAPFMSSTHSTTALERHLSRTVLCGGNADFSFAFPPLFLFSKNVDTD